MKVVSFYAHARCGGSMFEFSNGDLECTKCHMEYKKNTISEAIRQKEIIGVNKRIDKIKRRF